MLSTLTLAAPRITRPELRSDMPLVWREPGRLQVADTGTTIERATPGLYAWLQQIDGVRTWPQLAQLLDDADDPAPEDAARAVRLLAACGALNDAAAMPAHWRWSGADERYRELGDLAAAAHVFGDPHAANAVLERRNRVRASVVGDGPLPNATRRMLTASGMRTVDDASADVRILARGGFPDVFDDPTADDYDRPHLAVTVFGERALIGPMVVPGETSCLRCRHLHRLDADPSWSMVSLHLASAGSRIPVPPQDRLLVQLAAVRAVLMVRQWVDDPHRQQLWADFAWEVWLPAGLVQRIERPPHPLCGCRWSASR